MTSSDYVKLVDLAPSSGEYREVTTLMMSTAAGNVKRIHKVSATSNYCFKHHNFYIPGTCEII